MIWANVNQPPFSPEFLEEPEVSYRRVPLSKRLRFEILRRDGFRCVYCGATASDERLHVDHRTPVSLGGTNDEDNLFTACAPCNLGKSARQIYQSRPTFLVDEAWLLLQMDLIRRYRKRGNTQEELEEVCEAGVIADHIYDRETAVEERFRTFYVTGGALDAS